MSPLNCASLLLALTVLAAFLGQAAAEGAKVYPAPSRESPSYWREDAKADIRRARQYFQQIKNHRAKNVVFFLGDGMGMTTITAGRILKGQMQNSSGEEALLSFEKLPHTALVKTYNTDMQTPDSAGTATAYLGGVKAKTSTIGVDQNIISRNCSSYSPAHNVISFLEDAANAGKSVGIVTTTRITHASPAAAYAHIVWRDWESDSDRNRDVPTHLRDRCPDIAQQLIEKSVKLNVIFGGGRLKFLPKNVTTRDHVTSRIVNGSRSDGVNLVTEWKKKNAFRRAKYIETRDQLMSLDADSTDTVMGLFATSHMRYDVDNPKKLRNREPSLAEMTRKAVQLLSKNTKGFALFVEGGRIDHGHHENKAAKALHDLLAFDSAIHTALQDTSDSDTLTVVTADHSHVFSIGGWAGRGNAIFGKVRFSYYGDYNSDGEALANDRLPFTSIFYGDGPGAPINASRRDVTGVDTTGPNFEHNAIVHQDIESHGSEDVPVFASGPGAYLLHTTHEQSYLSNAIRHAMCIGDYGREDNCLPEISSSALLTAHFPAVMLLASLIIAIAILC